jgi:hypothetical protein
LEGFSEVGVLGADGVVESGENWAKKPETLQLLLQRHWNRRLFLADVSAIVPEQTQLGQSSVRRRSENKARATSVRPSSGSYNPAVRLGGILREGVSVTERNLSESDIDCSDRSQFI